MQRGQGVGSQVTIPRPPRPRRVDSTLSHPPGRPTAVAPNAVRRVGGPAIHEQRRCIGYCNWGIFPVAFFVATATDNRTYCTSFCRTTLSDRWKTRFYP